MCIREASTMRKLVAIFILNGMLLSACNAGEPNEERFKGLYFRYEGAEYESAFVRCSTDAIWQVEGDEAFKELVKLYKSKSSSLSPYGELLIEAKGRFSPTDKTRFPNSHYAGVFRVTGLISHSTDPQKIAECRKK